MQQGRESDKHLINRITDNVYFRFAHQLLTITAPGIGLLFMHIYSSTIERLDKIEALLTTKVATYDEKFIDHDQRLTRLENKNDWRGHP